MATEISTNSRNTFVWYAGCVTGNDRIGTTAIYLNPIDMHVVNEYTQNWEGAILESTRNPGLKLFAGTCKTPQISVDVQRTEGDGCARGSQKQSD